MSAATPQTLLQYVLSNEELVLQSVEMDVQFQQNFNWEKIIPDDGCKGQQWKGSGYSIILTETGKTLLKRFLNN